nr:MAG TPA: hypothetical protein [Caudoviricetes sp.]
MCVRTHKWAFFHSFIATKTCNCLQIKRFFVKFAHNEERKK